MGDDPWFDAYDGTRVRVDELVRDAGVAVDTALPACPGWTVRDAVAHMVGLVHDIVDENTQAYASAPWTSAQIGDTRAFLCQPCSTSGRR